MSEVGGEKTLPADSGVFLINYTVAGAILLLNIIISGLNDSTAKRAPGHLAVIEEGRVRQRGYTRCHLRWLVRFCTDFFFVWMQFLMLDVAESKYYGVWSVPPPLGPLTWESYTLAFLIPWCASLVSMVTAHVLLKEYFTVHFYRPCSLDAAEWVLLEEFAQPGVDDRPPGIHRRAVLETRLHTDDGVRFFRYRLHRHSFSKDEGAFVPPPAWSEWQGSALVRMWQDESDSSRADGEQSRPFRQAPEIHGPNIIHVELSSVFSALWHECKSPFHVYQYFSIWLMLYFDYITVALLTGFVTMGALCVKVSVERTTRFCLRQPFRTPPTILVLGTDQRWQPTSALDLVPGDLVLFSPKDPSGMVPADLVIVEGHCVADEANLTGETQPLAKEAIPNDDQPRPKFISEHRKHHLFAGTRAVSASGVQLQDGVSGCVCVVTGTAGHTARSDLMRSLLYDGHAPLEQEEDAHKVLTILLGIAMVGFTLLCLRYGFSLGPALSGTYLCIGLVSPLLSVAAVGGQLASSNRLRLDARVHCREVQRLAVVGAVEMMLFDKTGTLTEQGLNLIGCLPPGGSTGILPDISSIPDLEKAIALAHSVQLVRRSGPVSSLDAQQSPATLPPAAAPNLYMLVGNDLEIQMVNVAERRYRWSYNWDAQPKIRATHPRHGSFTVLRSFEFDHAKMTMSVIASDSEGCLHVFSKGSIEALTAASSRPAAPSFVDAASQCARTGCYVLACGHRRLKSYAEADLQALTREDVERELTLLGAFAFRNELKSDTADSIRVLQNGGVCVRMVTGDHALTAVSIARLSGIVRDMYEVWLGDAGPTGSVVWRSTDSGIEAPLNAIPRPAALAVTGAAFSLLQQTRELDSILQDGESRGLVLSVFARMSPLQKVAIVKRYQKLGLVVGFCGDGGNDSGALRAAHTGLALSGEAEASMAAPCVTSHSSLASLVTLVAEGRASLCTCIAAARFLVMKGVLFSIGRLALLLFSGGYLAPIGYLYIDLLMVPYFLWAITHTSPRPAGLAGCVPDSRLLSMQVFLAPALCLAVDFFFYFLAISHLSGQPWYVPLDLASIPLYEWQYRSDSYEAELTLLWVAWCIVDIAVIMSYGGQHRAALPTNKPVVFGAAGCHFVQLLILAFDNSRLSCAFKANCTEKAYANLSESILNVVLFSYERIGGPFYAPDGSNVLASVFKMELLVLLILCSVANHGIFLLIEGSATHAKQPALGLHAAPTSSSRRSVSGSAADLGAQVYGRAEP